MTDEQSTTDAEIPDVAAPTARVLVNALHARSGGGVTYLRNILPRLVADPGLEVHLCVHGEQAGDMPGGAAVTAHLAPCGSGFYATLIWEQLGLPRLARRIGADVVFSPANFGPLLARRPVVLLRNALDVGKTEKRIGKRLYWAVFVPDDHRISDAGARRDRRFGLCAQRPDPPCAKTCGGAGFGHPAWDR